MLTTILSYASGIFLWKLKATAFGRKDIGRVSDGSRGEHPGNNPSLLTC
jgi:hypothetical protein